MGTSRSKMARIPGPADAKHDSRDGPSREASHNAASKLHALLYGELRVLAGHMMRDQPPGQTLQATALVNEAYLKLSDSGKGTWESREHYLRAAACAMRNLLIDRARWRLSHPVVGLESDVDVESSPLDSIVIEHEGRGFDLIALDRALDGLAKHDSDLARAVEWRFFVGLDLADAARELGLSERTLRRHWAFARAWLHREMENEA